MTEENDISVVWCTQTMTMTKKVARRLHSNSPPSQSVLRYTSIMSAPITASSHTHVGTITEERCCWRCYHRPKLKRGWTSSTRHQPNYYSSIICHILWNTSTFTPPLHLPRPPPLSLPRPSTIDTLWPVVPVLPYHMGLT